jgi:hypothetical protein
LQAATEVHARKDAAVTYIVHASKDDSEMTTFRLNAVAAIAKARALATAGWHVFITCPDGTRFFPFEFEELALSQQATG